MPGLEENLANLVLAEMRRLNFDSAVQDEMGNVTGRIRGVDQNLGTLVLNSHLDHVDPGDLDLWPYPPYSAPIVDDFLIGRGACDIKGPLAVQLYSMAALKRMNKRPRRDNSYALLQDPPTGPLASTSCPSWTVPAHSPSVPLPAPVCPPPSPRGSRCPPWLPRRRYQRTRVKEASLSQSMARANGLSDAEAVRTSSGSRKSAPKSQGNFDRSSGIRIAIEQQLANRSI